MPMLNRREVLAGGVALLGAAGIANARAEAAMPPLVSADWLKAHLSDSNLRILAATDRRLYAQAHVPGAVFTDFGRWRVERNGVPAMLPDVPYLERLVGALGISPETKVVIVPAGFSAGDVGVATRIYWTLRTLGHAQAAVLDGGLRYWAEKKYPLEARSATPKPATYKARFTDRWLATRDDVKKAIAAGKPQLIDARTPGEYTGAIFSPSTGRPGTIKGAINVPQHWFVDPQTGLFRSKAQLAKIHDAMGDAGGEAIVFCNTGHRASLGWFARNEIMGRATRMYDGSMVEWGNLKPPEEYPTVARIDLRG